MSGGETSCATPAPPPPYKAPTTRHMTTKPPSPRASVGAGNTLTAIHSLQTCPPSLAIAAPPSTFSLAPQGVAGRPLYPPSSVSPPQSVPSRHCTSPLPAALPAPPDLSSLSLGEAGGIEECMTDVGAGVSSDAVFQQGEEGGSLGGEQLVYVDEEDGMHDDDDGADRGPGNEGVSVDVSGAGDMGEDFFCDLQEESSEYEYGEGGGGEEPETNGQDREGGAEIGEGGGEEALDMHSWQYQMRQKELAEGMWRSSIERDSQH